MQTRRLTRQGRRRKAELIHHGAVLFAERGYAETRVLDIVRAAGVAKGLFYWYFDNKEDLFRELIDDTRRRLRHIQAGAVRGVDDPLERLYRATLASARFMSDHHHLYALMQEAATAVAPQGRGFSEDVRRASEIHASDLATLLAEGQDRGVVRSGDVRLLAYGVVGSTWAQVQFATTQDPPVPVEEAAVEAARFALRAVAEDGAATRLLGPD